MKSYQKTGKVICEFIDGYKLNSDSQPRWCDILEHLQRVGHPTPQGRPWRQSSAQAALKNYCRDHNLDYPLRQRRGTVGNPRTNEITITLRITLPADQSVKVVVE
jgi:hypothetical protein